MATPYYTSDDLIDAIKRKIHLPIAQNTYSEDDLLAFANDEMKISLVPSILSYHEEFFVTTQTVSLVANQRYYPIPERAIGMKLRDVFYQDESGNLNEMIRINPEDKGFFENEVGGAQSKYKFYFQGNNLVLAPLNTLSVTGSLVFEYFLRPNQLVQNERAAIAQYFVKNISVDNTTIAAGDTVTVDSVVFTAVDATPATNEFIIGTTSKDTASNLASVINTNGVVIADNGSPATAVITTQYTTLSLDFETSNTDGFTIQTGQGIEFDSIPSNITVNSIVDFLKTKGGHSILGMDETIPNNSISGTTINFSSGQIPTTFIIGDYICSQYECIIPQVPDDLHPSLAEKTCARILASQGDMEGLATANDKIKQDQYHESVLVNNRVDGSPKKVLSRHTLLRYSKNKYRRI